MRCQLPLLAAFICLAATPAFADDTAVRERARALFEPIPLQAPEPEADLTSAERVELGKKLFFDPRMSRSGLISCQTCHNLGLGGADGLETSIGHGWQKGPRNAPTVLNAVFNVAQFWDGRAPDLVEQAKGPVQADVEMNNTPERVLDTLESIEAYAEAFEAAFPEDEEPLTFDNFGRAIEAFEATLITPDSRFDRFLRGDDEAMNAQEKRGLALFMDSGCASCHSGTNLGGQGYFHFGVARKPDETVLPRNDKGRFDVTHRPGDEYVFRVPTLRNVALTAPYFHSGKVWSLDEAVAIMARTQLGTDLDDGDVEDLVAFLDTLTGEQPQISYPSLPRRGSGTPRPSAE